MARLSNGLVIVKKYKISKFMDSSPWGDMYTVVHIETERLLKLIVLATLNTSYKNGIEKLLDNCNEFEGFIHKNIAETIDTGYLDPEKKVPYIITSFNKGDLLSATIKKRFPLGAPFPIVKRVIYSLSRVIDEVKDNFYHGFLNPDSILVTEVGRIKVEDYRYLISCKQDIPVDLISKGNESFLAPEIVSGGDGDFRSDIYSLGVIANKLISGKLLMEDGSPQLKSDTPEAVYETIKKCISPDPDERFQTATEFFEEFKVSIKSKKKKVMSAIMVDLLKNFQDDDEEDKKYMVQKGRLDYGPYSSKQIRERVIDEELFPDNIVVNRTTGFRKILRKHPDFQDFMVEYERRMEIKRREKSEISTQKQEKRQSRTLKLGFIFGLAGIAAIATSIILYKAVIDKSGGRGKKGSGSDDDILVSAGSDSMKKGGRKRGRRRRRRRRRKKGGDNYSVSGSAGKEIKAYAMDNKQLSRAQVNAVVNKSVINKIARKCVPSSGRINIRFQVAGRKGKVSYTSAKLNGKKNKKIARCAHGILKRLKFPKLDTDISGFGGVNF
jgi:serine/threonine protein kinase